MVFFSSLPSRHIIQITGNDTKAFLQSLLSVEVLKLNTNECRYGLLLSPQGKFLHDMFIIGQENGVLLDVCNQQSELLLKRLKLYKLKRDVQLALEEHWYVGVLFGDIALPPPTQNIIITPDPRLGALGFRAYATQPLTASTFNATVAKPQDYTKLRVSLGVPGSMDLIPEKSFPLDYELDNLCAIDYRKGCYVGQEVTARMHYRGNTKKGVYIVESTDGSALPTGAEITADGKTAGIIASVVENQGIAMIRHEYANGALLAGNVSIKPTRPAWAKPVANPTEESL